MNKTKQNAYSKACLSDNPGELISYNVVKINIQNSLKHYF